MNELGQYMYVSSLPVKSPSGKTNVWSIFDLRGELLGTVSWFGRWRCYAFNPCEGTTFNGSCMDVLSEFCKKRTLDHRNKTE